MHSKDISNKEYRSQNLTKQRRFQAAVGLTDIAQLTNILKHIREHWLIWCSITAFF